MAEKLGIKLKYHKPFSVVVGNVFRKGEALARRAEYFEGLADRLGQRRAETGSARARFFYRLWGNRTYRLAAVCAHDLAMDIQMEEEKGKEPKSPIAQKEAAADALKRAAFLFEKGNGLNRAGKAYKEIVLLAYGEEVAREVGKIADLHEAGEREEAEAREEKVKQILADEIRAGRLSPKLAAYANTAFGMAATHHPLSWVKNFRKNFSAFECSP